MSFRNQPDQQLSFDLFYAEHAAPGYRFALRLGQHATVIVTSS